MKGNLTFRQVLLEHFQHYTISYMKGACFFLLASLGMFVDTFKDENRTSIALLSFWQMTALLAKCLVPGIAAVSAFLSTSVADKRAEKKEREAKAERANPHHPLV